MAVKSQIMKRKMETRVKIPTQKTKIKTTMIQMKRTRKRRKVSKWSTNRKARKNHLKGRELIKRKSQ